MATASPIPERREELYPTRLDEPMPRFRRHEPVIHGGTDAPGPLSPHELRQFERDGFLAFPDFLPADQMTSFIDAMDELSRDQELLDRRRTIREPGGNEVRSIFAVHEISRRFWELTRDPRLLDMARQILDSDVYIHQSRINYKPGFKGKGFNWHSDFETWHSEDGMPRMRCVSFSILATENNEFNGPLMLIPGSHQWFVPCVGRTPEDNYKESLRNQTLGVPDTDNLARLMDEGGIVAPKGGPGTLIMFECNTLHASNANMSAYPRSNLFFVYNSVENKLVEPYAGTRPRPEFLGARTHTPTLQPVDDAA